MAAITQPRFGFPYTGRRYGSFAGKTPSDTGNVPDFMHGTINLRPYVLGAISVQPHLNGSIRTNP